MTRLAASSAVFLAVFAIFAILAGASVALEARAADGDDPAGAAVALDLERELKTQFDELSANIRNRRWFDKIASQAYRRESLILATDRDAAGVVLRRTEALLTHLQPAIGPSEYQKFAVELGKLREAAGADEGEDRQKGPSEIVLMKGWQVARGKAKTGLGGRFYLADYDPDFDLDLGEARWENANIKEGKRAYRDRYIFYRKSVSVPAEWEGKKVSLSFGGVDDNAEVYVNGRRVGRNKGRNREFSCDVTKVIRPGQKALVAVLCENTGGAGGVYGKVTLAPGFEGGGRYDLYAEVCKLRRRIAFANPLLDFDKIIFMKCHFTKNHCCDQYFGFNAKPGGGVYVLSKPFGGEPRLSDIVGDSTVERGRLKGQKLSTGSFRSLSLSFDASTVFFAYTQCDRSKGNWSPGISWHIFKARSDGTGLEQLTDGTWNELAPCELPSGRIAFISERRGGFGRCHPRPVPTYTLHSMMPDGSDISPLSYHETNEWHPSVNHDGMIVYSRWDYVDRGDCIAHHPWITFPDGRDPRAIQGNFPVNRNARPDMELHVRAIPGSHKYVATAAGHHRQAYGSLVVIDPRIEDDGAMAPVRRITPEIPFPEVERGGHAYATAWPLSEHYYLSVYAPGAKGTLGVYVVDALGNKELLYRDPAINCLHPVPFRPRKRPPVIPHATAIGKPDGSSAGKKAPATGIITCVNVYQGLMEWPAGTKIEALRIIQLFPKATIKIDQPKISFVQESLARSVLGTVPVEEDGSAHFTAPAGKLLYFQALDPQGRAVQSMKSDTYVHPGERLNCQGCHEPRLGSPPQPSGMPKAFLRPPSTIAPDVDGTDPVSFPRLVQPVLERNCVPCHQKEKKAPDLSGAGGGKSGWSKAYSTLSKFAHGGSGKPPSRQPVRTTPGKFGARAAKLYQMLAKGEKGHDKLKLSSEDMHRIVVWLDCNSNFYGAYKDLDRQLKGELVRPELE